MILSGRCAVVGGIFATAPSSAILRKKVGKPKEEIRNLYRITKYLLCEFVYVNLLYDFIYVKYM
jgi:hypothetical protein